MIGSDKSRPALMSHKTLEPQLTIEVDVIQPEDGKSARERSRLLQVRMDVRFMKMSGKRRCHRPSQPLVKVPENDSRPVQFFVDDDSFVAELPSLFALFEEARPEMDIKDMQGRVIEADIGSEAASPFATAGGDVVVMMPLDRKSRQHNVAVTPALMPTVFAEGEMETQLSGYETSLIFFA